MAKFPPYLWKDGVAACSAAALATLGIGLSDFPTWGVVVAIAVFGAFLLQRHWPRVTVSALIVVLAVSALQPLLTVGTIVAVCTASYITWRRLPTPDRYCAAAILSTGSASFVAFFDPFLNTAPWQQRIPYIAWAVILIAMFSLIGMMRRRNAEQRRREMEWLLDKQRQEYELASAHQREFIAQEIHDVVTHSLTGIVAQADAGRYSSAPEGKAEALATIGTIGRESLREMREIVTVLRHGQPRERHAMVSHRDLASLLNPDTDTFTVHGSPPPTLRASVSLALYRIAQEALTNARRHGHGSATVTLTWEATTVRLCIDNPYTPTTPTHQGLGLAGMHRRAESAGGTLEIVSANGHWIVSALFHLEHDQ